MGYAIKLSGISAPNLGLGQVTIGSRGYFVTEAYFDAMSTGTDAEKTAYRTLVDGLIAAGIYDKIKFMNPMLGSTVADKLVDSINPSDTNPFYTQCDNNSLLSTFSIDAKGYLVNSASSSATMSIGFKNFGSTPWSVIAGYYYTASSSAVGLMAGTVALATLNSRATTKYPAMKFVGGSEFPSSDLTGLDSLSSVKNRFITWSFDGETKTIYSGDTLWASASDSTTLATWEFNRLYTFNTTPMNFFALCDKLTATEIATFNSLVSAFQTTLGRVYE